MVSEIRVPSSSSSSSNQVVSSCQKRDWGVCGSSSRTDGKGLDLDALLDVRVGSIVGFLVLEDRLAAEGVDKGGPACSDNCESKVRIWVEIAAQLERAAAYQFQKHHTPSGRTECLS